MIDAVKDPIEVLGLDPLPGSRHGVEGPTALVRLRWRGARPDLEALQRLEERLAHALWCLERLDWKGSEYGSWRELDAAIPIRPFPNGFLVEPAPDRLSGLLAAGLTALQWGALMPVTSARVLADDGDQIALAVPYWLPQPLQGALALLLQLVGEAAAGVAEGVNQADWRSALELALERGHQQRALDLDGFHLAWEARQRGLPLVRIDFGVLEIGHGVSCRRFLGHLHGLDAVASLQVSNKLVSKRQLLRAGMPVPSHAVVDTEEQALSAAQALGWPVVLKPIDLSLEKGVTTNIWRAVDLLRAYRKARAVSQKPLLVEPHVSGHDLRILVLGGEVAAAALRCFVTVRGDGFQSLGQLIARAAAACTDPQDAALYDLDRQSRRLIDDQGLSLEEVVESGRVVKLRLWNGWPPHHRPWENVQDKLHPDLLQLAVRAARVMGVRMAGIDLITTDVSQPPLQTGAVVLELNPRPWLRMFRSSPSWQGLDRRVLESGCPGDLGSIPVLLLDGSARAERLLQSLEAALLEAAQVVGSWCDPLVADQPLAQVRIGGEPVLWTRGEESLEAPGQLVLSDALVEVALLNLAPETWQANGFPCSRVQVGVLIEADVLQGQGLLAEWLSVVEGPVLVVNGSATVLEVVAGLVGDRLVSVKEEGAALEIVQALLASGTTKA